MNVWECGNYNKSIQMKLIFFLVAFCLLSLRVYFSWSGKDMEKRGISESNMVIKSDNFYEEIKYSGIFRLTDDETGFKSISPGGYFKFQKNEVLVKAESNLKGEIEYWIYDGKNNLSIENEEGKKLVAESIKDMIARGFNASARMEHIYSKGGISALLSEVDSMHSDQVKILYLKRLFTVDSLSPENRSQIINKINSLSSDRDKSDFLNKISFKQLNNPQIADAYFIVLEGIRSDMEKTGALQRLIDQDSISIENENKIMDMTSHLGSDLNKANLFRKMIAKGMITGPHFDSLLNLVSYMGSDIDKSALYRNLLEENNISESQWVSLINKTSSLGSDIDKTNLLIGIAQKMPKSDNVKMAYLKAAKLIGNDSDYGKVVRAIE